jgi:hypothetical protein
MITAHFLIPPPQLIGTPEEFLNVFKLQLYTVFPKLITREEIIHEKLYI